MLSSRPIRGSRAAISGPLSRPVRARRSGWKSALAGCVRSLPSGARPAAARAIAPVEPAGGVRGRREEGAVLRRGARCRHGRAGSPTSRPPRRRSRDSGRIAAQSASAIPAGSRSATAAKGSWWTMRALRPPARRGRTAPAPGRSWRNRSRRSAAPARRRARPAGWCRSARAWRAGPRLDPRFAQRLDAESSRAASTSLPSEPVSRASCAKAGGAAPSASNIWSCRPVLVTWSSPRTTWVTPISTSSTTLGSM